MTAVLERASRVDAEPDERRARADLRAQIARLERRLASLPAGPVRAPRRAGPALLGIAELERVRDELAARVADRCAAADREACAIRDAHAQLEALLADPRAHRRTAVALRDLGLPGCGVYRARPRLGMLGRLAGWWRVTLSSGCP